MKVSAIPTPSPNTSAIEAYVLCCFERHIQHTPVIGP